MPTTKKTPKNKDGDNDERPIELVLATPESVPATAATVVEGHATEVVVAVDTANGTNTAAEAAAAAASSTVPLTHKNPESPPHKSATKKEKETINKTAISTTSKKPSPYPLYVQCDRFKMESLFRVALCCGLGSAFTVTPTQNGYIPNEGKYLIGFFASFLPIFYPKLVFGILGMAPHDSTMMVWCCCMTTVLYYIAEQYGQDWMVVAYAVYILLISSFFFGETYAQTSGFACFYTGILSMITIIFFSKLDYPENPVEDKSTLLTASQMWTEHGIDNPKAIFRNFLILWCYAWTCVVLMMLLPFPRTARSVFTRYLLPNAMQEIIEYNLSSLASASASASASAVVSANSNDATTTVTKSNQGDVEAQGQQQQLYSNDDDDDDEERKKDPHKMVHWAFELRGMSKAGLTKYEPRLWKNENLVEPLATLMSDVTTLARVSIFRYSEYIPGVLKEAEEEQMFHDTNERRRHRYILEMCSDALRNSSCNSCSSSSSSGTGGSTNDDLMRLRKLPSSLEWYETTMAERRKRRQKKNNIISHSDDGNNSTVNDDDDDVNDKVVINNNTNNIDIVSEHETLHSYGTRFYLEKVERVKQSTIMWLDCLNGNTKQQMTPNEIVQNRIEFNLMWIVQPLLMIITRLYQFMGVLAQPSRWEWWPFCWSVKYSVGLTVLFALEIYQPNYASLGVDFEIQEVYTTSTHQGWALLGYTMAWRPTVEGTVKKGLMRIVGTALGGFVGWVGVIVCAWSFDEHKRPNPYGTVIWTTFFTTAAAYLSTDTGPSGLFGSTYSHGFLGFYFCMVQALVILSVYTQPVTRDVVVVTRVVETSVGVLFAMIIQFIPPNIYGRYARDIIPCLEEIQSVFKNTVDAALSLHQHQHPISKDSNDNVGMDGSSSSSLPELYKTSIVSGKSCDQIKAVYKLLNHRLYLAQDAGALSFLPLMKLHPQTIPLLEEIMITLDFIKRLERIIAGLQENPDRDSLIKELYSVMRMGRSVPVRTTRRRSSAATHNSATIIDDNDGSGSTMNFCDTTDSKELKNVLDGTSLFPGVTKLIETRLLDHETELQSLL